MSTTLCIEMYTLSKISIVKLVNIELSFFLIHLSKDFITYAKYHHTILQLFHPFSLQVTFIYVHTLLDGNHR